MPPADAYIRASIGIVLLFLLIMTLALLAYSSDITVGPRPVYRWLLREDGWVETLIALLLAVATVLALVAALRVPEKLQWSRTFFALRGILDP
jgi:hypothetical protein